MTAAEQIKELRKLTGLSQEKFGEYIGGASRRTVQDWERGIIEPPTYAMHLIKFKIETDRKENSGE